MTACRTRLVHREGWVRVEVTGDLDAFGAAELGQVLREAADAGSDDLRVDLTGLDFVDASGIGVLARRWVTIPHDFAVALQLSGASERFWQLSTATRRQDVFLRAS